MPTLIGALLGALIQGMGTLVGRVLISLGIGYVSYAGIDTLATAARDDLLQRIQGAGAVVLQLAGVLQIGTCINILVSALLARFVVAGLTNGALTRMVQK